MVMAMATGIVIATRKLTSRKITLRNIVFKH